MQAQKYETVEEMRKAASEKFSESEIDNFMALGRKLACWPVLSELLNIVDERIGSTPNGQKLITDIQNTIEFRNCGHIKLPMHDDSGPVLRTEDGDEVMLGMSLSITKTGEYPTINVPAEYLHDVLSHMHQLLSTAVAFWGTYHNKHKKLVKRIAKACPEVDFSSLKQDDVNKTVLYFDPKSSTRICVFAYYFNDKTKKIYWHRPADAEADNAETPVDNAETPVDNAETPVDNAETPVDNAETPVDNAEAITETNV